MDVGVADKIEVERMDFCEVVDIGQALSVHWIGGDAAQEEVENRIVSGGVEVYGYAA